MAFPSHKKAARYLSYTLFGSLVVVGVLAWLAGTEAALQWGARQAERMSDGRLSLRGVQGSLYGPLSVAEFSYRSADKHFEVKQARLDWSPLALLRRHLEVTQFSLHELRVVEIKPSAEPLALPDSLRLPVTVTLPARIDRLVLRIGGREDVLGDIELGLEKREAYRLKLRSVTTAWGKGAAELTLGDSRPFPVTGHLALQQMQGITYAIDADISGSLEQLLLEAAAKAGGGTAQLAAKLAPFARMPLLEGSASAERIDPALLRKDLPKAEISAAMAIAGHAATGQLQGKLTLRNHLPGPWDRGRLPLRQIALQLAGPVEQLKLGAVQLDLADAGGFSGEGQITQGQLRLALKTRAFDPHGVHTKARSMRLAGDVHLQASAERQQLGADLRYQRFALHLDARHEDAMVTLNEAAVRSGTGSLSLHGTLGLAGAQSFQLAGALQGFNPAEFGDYPAARVNASFTGKGHLAREPQATLAFAIADSHFRQQPLSGQGRLSISAKRLWDSAVSLRLAHNRLELSGALGQAGDRLVFDLDAKQLALFDPQLAGQVQASGSVEGRFAAPSGTVDVQAGDLSWRKQYRIASLRAAGRLDKGLDGPLALDASVQGLVTPRLRLDRIGVHAAGTRDRQTLDLQAMNADLDLDARLTGAWREESGWAGQITRLANRGRYPVALQAPARFELGKQHLWLSNARFEFVGATVMLHDLAYDAGQIASRGEFTGLPLSALQGFVQDTAELKTDLRLGGDWQFAARKTVDGHLALYRERGDVIVPTVPQTALGLSRLALKLTAANDQLRGELEAAGSHLGRLRANGQTMLSRRDGVWGIAGTAPMQAQADLAVDSLAWAQPLLDPTGALVFDGVVRAGLAVSGSAAQPRLTGNISGERFQIALPDQGLRLRDGRFEAELRDQVLQLTSLSLRGGDGTLTGQGRLALEGDAPSMQVSLKADKLELLSRPDRYLALSGSGDATVADKKVNITARLKADRGLIELPKSDAPTPSDDVVVLGRGKPPAKKSAPYLVGFDLDLDLGERFFFQGKGLDAQLGGAVRLTSVPGALPTSRGSIRVVKGAYLAYGQRLEIERGILNFQGPVDNPGLNIIALRKNQPVEAGVAVTGTAQSPQVRLVSNPSVPDSEKLSWLVLGHGLEDSSGQEFSALQAAAGALLAAGESITLQQRIAHAAGLEEVSLKGAGGLEGSVLALGKRLSSRAYLSYEQGLAGAGTLVKINYTLTRRLSVRAQAGNVPALDLFYTFSFD